MEICPAPPPPAERPQSKFTMKNRICLGHDEFCNCCCCCNPQRRCLKYIQPKIPKSFKPPTKLSHRKYDVPMEQNTTYKLSYWDGPITTVSALKPVLPRDSLSVGDGAMTDETIHKLSYLGNWYMKRDDVYANNSLWKTEKQWLGRGPMQNDTTHKNDFTWKYIPTTKPRKISNDLYCPSASMSDDTTYKVSYYDSHYRLPLKSYKPKMGKHVYRKSDVPIEECTTYKLSYWPNKIPLKEKHPWKCNMNYCRSPMPLDDSTIYNLSYYGGCGDGNGNEKRKPIKPIVRPMEFSACPLSHDTIHRMSYLGNWSVPRERAQVNLTWKTARQWVSKGPLEDVTTHKHDFTWKRSAPDRIHTHPEDNLGLSSLPLECCTTHKLSYFPNDINNLVRDKAFKPKVDCTDYTSDVPMERETTMRLSYQPVGAAMPQRKPWAKVIEYHSPITPIDDDTVYNLSYIPPGTLEPLYSHESCPPMSDDACQGSCNNSLSQSSSSIYTSACCEPCGAT